VPSSKKNTFVWLVLFEKTTHHTTACQKTPKTFKKTKKHKKNHKTLQN
jgi:hypothetical protein